MRSAAAALVAGGLLMSTMTPVTPAAAQSSQEAQADRTKTDWSEQKLDAFAKASIAVSQQQVRWQQRMKNVDNQRDRRRMIEKRNADLEAAVERHGITFKEFGEVHEAARNDPDLYEDLLRRIQDHRSE